MMLFHLLMKLFRIDFKGSSTSQMDGAWVFYSPHLHNQKWRLVLRNIAVGAFLTW